MSEMDSRDSVYEPVEALHVVISCDYQRNLFIANCDFSYLQGY
jgi:hypothetical protein